QRSDRVVRAPVDADAVADVGGDAAAGDRAGGGVDIENTAAVSGGGGARIRAAVDRHRSGGVEEATAGAPGHLALEGAAGDRNRTRTGGEPSATGEGRVAVEGASRDRYRPVGIVEAAAKGGRVALEGAVGYGRRARLVVEPATS